MNKRKSRKAFLFCQTLLKVSQTRCPGEIVRNLTEKNLKKCLTNTPVYGIIIPERGKGSGERRSQRHGRAGSFPPKKKKGTKKMAMWQIQIEYDDYRAECEEKGIEPEYKDALSWWKSLE